MASLLQQVCVHPRLDPERTSPVHRMAHGGRHYGQLVWKIQVGHFSHLHTFTSEGNTYSELQNSEHSGRHICFL